MHIVRAILFLNIQLALDDLFEHEKTKRTKKNIASDENTRPAQFVRLFIVFTYRHILKSITPVQVLD